MDDDVLITLAAVFVPFSLLSIGGGSAILAGIQHESVGGHGWVTASEFVDLFAVSRAAPGPGTMLATLIGWKAAGWPGAIVATLALFVPSSVLCYCVVKVSNIHRQKKWHKALRDGLAPVGVGLTVAGAMTIFRLSGGGLVGAAFALSALAAITLVPRFPIVGILIVAGLAGAFLGEQTMHL